MSNPEHISQPIKRLLCKWWFGDHDWLPNSTFGWYCARCKVSSLDTPWKELT